MGLILSALTLLFGLQLSIANAALPPDVNWLYQLTKDEQGRAILLLRNVFHSKNFQRTNNAKSDDEKSELAFKNSVSIQVLSTIAIDKQLKELLTKEAKLIGDIYVLGFENTGARVTYSDFKPNIDNKFSAYSRDSLMAVFEKYHPQMEKTVSAVEAYSEEMLKELSTNSPNRTNQISLSKALSDEINTIIKQNKGIVRVGPATYLNASLSSGNSLVLSFVTNKGELAEALVQREGESYKNALDTINSIEFKESLSAIQSETLNNYYCSLESTRRLLKMGGSVVVNYVFDDGVVPSGPIVIDSTSCKSHGYFLNK